MARITQKDRLRTWLKQGKSITRFQFAKWFHAFELSRPILELEAEGMIISRERVNTTNTFGDPTSYTIYSMVEV